MPRKDKETVRECVDRIMRESRFDVDVEYCKENNIKFPQREEDLDDEDVLFARLADTKRNKAIFDFLTSCEEKTDTMIKSKKEKIQGTYDVWDWIVTNEGKVVQITSDDMMDLPYEMISRHALDEEIPNKL